MLGSWCLARQAGRGWRIDGDPQTVAGRYTEAGRLACRYTEASRQRQTDIGTDIEATDRGRQIHKGGQTEAERQRQTQVDRQRQAER